jgi:hypothetical protein
MVDKSAGEFRAEQNKNIFAKKLDSGIKKARRRANRSRETKQSSPRSRDIRTAHIVSAHANSSGYSTETRTTPDLIMPSARAALVDTSMTRPRMNGPRSLTRQRIE